MGYTSLNRFAAKKNHLLSLSTILLFSFASVDLDAQMIIWSEDFEDHGNTANGGAGRYTSTNDFHDGASDDDYFGRVAGASEEYFLTDTGSGIIANSVVTYSGWNGNFFYAAEDLDDTGGVIGSPDELDFKDVTFTGIDISGGTNLEFRGLFATGENDPCGSSAYDFDDFVEVYYDVDGGGEVTTLCFNADLHCNIPDDVTNEPLYFDNSASQGGACDGDGGGGVLMTAAFSEITFPIPSGESLDLRIRVSMNALSEEFAFDYFRVYSDTPLCEVSNNNDSGPGSLRAGIECIAAGGTLTFSPLLISNTIILDSQKIIIDKDLTIFADEIQQITIDGTALNNTFTINSLAEVAMIGFNIVGGNGPDGVVWNQGSLTLDSIEIAGDGNPGAIFVNDGILEMKDGSKVSTTP